MEELSKFRKAKIPFKRKRIIKDFTNTHKEEEIIKFLEKAIDIESRRTFPSLKVMRYIYDEFYEYREIREKIIEAIKEKERFDHLRLEIECSLIKNDFETLSNFDKMKNYMYETAKRHSLKSAIYSFLFGITAFPALHLLSNGKISGFLIGGASLYFLGKSHIHSNIARNITGRASILYVNVMYSLIKMKFILFNINMN